MNLQSIIDDLASSADDYLAYVTNRKEARESIGEVLTKRYPKLNGIERQKVLVAVMGILEEEGFFESSQRGDSWSDGEDSDDE